MAGRHIQTFQGGGLEPRLAYLWAAIPSGWEGLLGVRCSDVPIGQTGSVIDSLWS